MKIAIFGGSPSGLVFAACLAEFGYTISLMDFSPKKIDFFKLGNFDIYEPGLDFLLQKALTKQSLEFSMDISKSLENAEVIIISLSTTNKDTFDIDLTQFYIDMKNIIAKLNNTKYTPIIVISTINVGVCTNIKRSIEILRPDLIYGQHYIVLSYNCFLRDGSAINDFLNPSRIVIGYDLCDEKQEKLQEIIQKIFAPILHENLPNIITNFETAELICTASCSFSVIKSAFINEIALLCSKIGADIDTTIKGLRLDKSISNEGLLITPGAAGLNPRMAKILTETAEMLGSDLTTLKGAIKSNINMVTKIVQQIISVINLESEGKNITVSILGLTFKAHTNDIRSSVSIDVIKQLLNLDVNILAYDPAYNNTNCPTIKLPKEIAKHKNFSLVKTVYEAAEQSDAIVIMTNWPEFLSVNWIKISELMNTKKQNNPIMIDFRNMFTFEEMKNFKYIPQGKIKK